MDWNRCVDCEYAKRDSHGRFLDRCDGFGNCSFVQYEGEVALWPVEQMKELLAGATVSKFATPGECRAFREGINQCIRIMERESE